jgi:hypothetical protein
MAPISRLASFDEHQQTQQLTRHAIGLLHPFGNLAPSLPGGDLVDLPQRQVAHRG